MTGAIAGDIIGSVYEFEPTKRVDFQLFHQNSQFTDDTVLTIAIADAILNSKPYDVTLHTYGRKYPYRGYGGYFSQWLRKDDLLPYNSFGNGSAMRVSPVGFAFNSLDEVLQQAKRSAEVTHNHPAGIKGAQAIASAIFLAKENKSKKQIKQYIINKFGYNLDRNIREIREIYEFDVTCQGSVPEAIIAFLESDDLESAVRLGVSLGGDADTIACMAGGIAQAFYREIPGYIYQKVTEILNPELLKVVNEFEKKFEIRYKII